MKAFLIKALLFGFIVIAIDRSLFLFIQYNRPADYKIFIESKKSFFENNNDYDVLVIGDSHIADALNTKIIDKELNLKSFNLGIYSASPFENYFVIKDVLQHLDKMPDMVVLGTNHIMFQRPMSKGPYTSLIVNNDFNLTKASKDGLDKAYFIKSVQEEYVLKTILKNKLLGKNYEPTREISSVYNGYLEFHNQTKNVDWKADKYKENEKIAVPEQMEYFKKTINYLKQNGIKVVIANPPLWRNQLEKIHVSSSFIEFDRTIRTIAQEFDLLVLNPDHHMMNSVLEQEDFLDLEHLNFKGAKKYTHNFCEQVKNKVKK